MRFLQPKMLWETKLGFLEDFLVALVVSAREFLRTRSRNPGTSPRTPRESPRKVRGISRKRLENLLRRAILGKDPRKTLPKESREPR